MTDRRTALAFFTAGLASAATVIALRLLLAKPHPKVLPSPLEAYSKTPASALRRLPYPPIDFIPGARDVNTPYGAIRLYEWGPETAQRKVLLLHGISGSCVVLLTLAETLVANGCRVMLLDLFGRGWSGGPSDLPYDDRLYATQIFMSLASSPISWTGGDRGSFNIIGYSLGGGIAADFASWFPQWIEDLVLIAPGGLMKSDWRSRMLYSGYVPQSRMQKVLRGRLLESETAVGVASMLGPDLADEEVAAQASDQQTFLERVKNIDADGVVAWQLEHNAGFVPAFVSSIRYAPTKCQHDRWRMLGHHNRVSKIGGIPRTFTNGNVMLILGGQDSIISPATIVPDAKDVLGEDQLEVKVYDEAGHSVGMSHGADIADLLLRRWKNAM